MTDPIALAGIGAIAREEHLPALEASDDWHLAATISRNSGIDGVRGYHDIDAFLADPGDIRTVSLALPPGPRFDYAVKAMRAGFNVMLEKPPTISVAAARRLEEEARAAGVTLYASWHSRMGAACAWARDRLARTPPRHIAIDWREDVRQIHPGQDWVWEPGNLGVFDPGINAFSILALVLPQRMAMESCHMIVPEGRQTPIAADLALTSGEDCRIEGRFDWRHDGDPIWTLEVETEEGSFTITRSGSGIVVDGSEIELDGSVAEYPLVYARLAELVRNGEREVDLRPLEISADAFLIASRETGAPFDW